MIKAIAYTGKVILFSIVMTFCFSVICTIIGISHFWGLIPTLICNVIFISKYPEP